MPSLTSIIATASVLTAAGVVAGGSLQGLTFQVIVDRGSVADVSDSGFVVGMGEVDPNNPGQEGFRWTAGGGFEILPLQEGTQLVSPLAVAEDGTVAGFFRPTGVQNDERAVAFDPVTLGATILSDNDFGRATAIDANGRLYGQASVPADAYTFGTLNAPADVQLLPGIDASTVNGSGVDFALGSVDGDAAVVRADGTFDLLPDPGTLGGFISRKAVVATNSAGEFVGNIIDTFFNGELRRPVFWDANQNPVILDGLAPNFSRVQAFDLDESGTIAGSSVSLSSGDSRATLWIDGEPIDLNTLVETPDNIVLISAQAINESGVIVGNFANLDLPLGSAQGGYILFPESQPCPADVTGDGQIDLADLNLVLANFGQVSSDGDTNDDGQVDLADLNAVLAAFGQACP